MSPTVAKIREMLRMATAEEFEAIERSLAADARKGVKAELGKARRRLAAEAAEAERIASLHAFDRACVDGAEDGVVVGLDEVGRGSVAGPLAVGAVILPARCAIANLNDSKKLTPAERASAAEEIKRQAVAWVVSFVEASYIDANGMALSLRRAFSDALDRVEHSGCRADVVLLDGLPLGIDERERNVVKGDSKSAAIAAASIVAKVTRDEFMCSIDSTYPQYGFSENKGYASEAHVEAIRVFGLSPVHRASFCRSFLQESLF